MRVFYSNDVPYQAGRKSRIAIAVASDREEAARMIRGLLNRENMTGSFTLEELKSPPGAEIIEPEFWPALSRV